MKNFKLMLVALMAMMGVNSFAEGADNAVGKKFTDVLGIQYEILTTYQAATTTTPAVQGTVKVLKYTNTLLTTDIEIPESTTNVESTVDIPTTYLYKVVEIGDYSATDTQFKGAKAGKITIPATVTAIGASAFEEIEATEVVIKAGSGLLSIGNNAFKGATKLAAFGSANALGLQTIGQYAFQGTALTTFTFGVDLTKVGYGAFKGTKITSLDFSACTKFSAATGTDVILRWFTDDVADSGFNTNATLTTVKLPASLATAANKVDIAANAFKGCTALTTIGATANTAVIPASVSVIGVGAFTNTGITKVDMSASAITAIAGWFSKKPATGTDLSKLQQIILKNDVAYTSFSGLTDISTLKKVGITDAEYALPAKTTAAAIADGIFAGTALEQIDLSKVEAAVTTFPTIVKGITTLTAVVINNQTTVFKAEAFYGCTSLSSLTVKDKDGNAKDLTAITDVNTGAFYRTALSSLTFGADLATFATPWAINTADAAVAAKAALPYTLATSLSVDLSACATAFATTGIPANTFQKVATLTSIKLPATLTKIGANAFEGTGLTSIDLPATIAQDATTAANRGIATKAFKDCASLTKITFYPETETGSIFAADDVFTGCAMVGIYATATYATLAGTAPTYSKWVTSGAVTVETVKDKVHPYAMKGFIADGNYSFDAEECQVYEAYIDGTEVVMSPLQKRNGKYNVPANSAVIVRTAEATTINPLTYTPTTTNSSLIFGRMSVTTTDPWGENVLRSTYINLGTGFNLEEELTRAQVYKNYMYVLVNNATAGFGFQHFTGTKIKKGNIFVINPNNVPAGARLNIVWLDENGNVEYDATAIQSIEASEAEDGAVYNLAGQKVSAAYKGVVIKDGKKYIMK